MHDEQLVSVDNRLSVSVTHLTTQQRPECGAILGGNCLVFIWSVRWLTWVWRCRMLTRRGKLQDGRHADRKTGEKWRPAVDCCDKKRRQTLDHPRSRVHPLSWPILSNMQLIFCRFIILHEHCCVACYQCGCQDLGRQNIIHPSFRTVDVHLSTTVQFTGRQ